MANEDDSSFCINTSCPDKYNLFGASSHCASAEGDNEVICTGHDDGTAYHAQELGAAIVKKDQDCGSEHGGPGSDSPSSNVANSTLRKHRRRTRSRKLIPTVEGDKVIAERFRTKLCRNYLQHPDRPCPYEDRCMFAHGDHELRTAAQNTSDGLTSEEAIRELKRKERQERLKDKNLQWASPPRTPLVIWPVLSEHPACPVPPSTPVRCPPADGREEIRPASGNESSGTRGGASTPTSLASPPIVRESTPIVHLLDASFSLTDSPGHLGRSSFSTHSLTAFRSSPFLTSSSVPFSKSQGSPVHNPADAQTTVFQNPHSSAERTIMKSVGTQATSSTNSLSRFSPAPVCASASVPQYGTLTATTDVAERLPREPSN